MIDMTEINIVVELSERLADESDYEDYLMPKLEQLITFILEKQNDLIYR